MLPVDLRHPSPFMAATFLMHGTTACKNYTFSCLITYGLRHEEGSVYYYKDCRDISLWKMAKHTGLRAWLQGVGHTASTSSFPHFNYGWLEARHCHRPQIKLKYDKAEISGWGLLQALSHVRRRYPARNYNICQYFFDGRFNMDMSERERGRHEVRLWHMIKSTFHFAFPMDARRLACIELPRRSPM